MSAVKNKFENYESQQQTNAPKPMRSITPPRAGQDRSEIENEPTKRAPEVVSSTDKNAELLPESGIARSRKEMFQHIADTSSSLNNDSTSGRGQVKAITPPRDEIVRRVLKEVTPDRNENVIRESDRNEDKLPSAGTAKQTAAMFASSSLSKSIERSGIVIEGELAEKGIAKSRLALFANNQATAGQSTPNKDTSDIDNDIRNASGIAKERLNLFKNLEQQSDRASPPKEMKKFKEFTPPPQLEPHQIAQRQYIIIVSLLRFA
jgi:hypothetical protein